MPGLSEIRETHVKAKRRGLSCYTPGAPCRRKANEDVRAKSVAPARAPLARDPAGTARASARHRAVARAHRVESALRAAPTTRALAPHVLRSAPHVHAATARTRRRASLPLPGQARDARWRSLESARPSRCWARAGPAFCVLPAVADVIAVG